MAIPETKDVENDTFTKVVNIDNNYHNIDRKDSKLAVKVKYDTWDTRYNSIMSPQGYNNGRKIIKKLGIDEWLKVTGISPKSPVSVFIYGTYMYNSTNRQGLLIDFAKLSYCPILRKKINYFSLYRENELAVHKLFTILRREGYHLEIKSINDLYTETLIPELALCMLVKAYESIPEPKNMLVMAEDNILIPTINHISNELNIKVTMAISKNCPLSNFYLNKFDYIINTVELMEYAQCVSNK